MSFADYGYPVKITDATPEALQRGMARIRANYETSVKRGSLAQEEKEPAPATESPSRPTRAPSVSDRRQKALLLPVSGGRKKKEEPAAEPAVPAAPRRRKA